MMDALAKEYRGYPEDGDRYAYVKRGQDALLTLTAMVLLGPLFALIGLLVWLDCPEVSPIFTQTRVGKDGRKFRLYKFRTMEPNAEQNLEALLGYNEMDGPCFKLRKDPRITPFGRLLRRSGLDELPQLWNVLRGDMSLVGPRPALPREVVQYGAYERQRLTIRPGITCYWQIQPERNALSFEKWMELDMQYLQDRSFLTDWKILFATVRAVLRMDGQ